MHLHNTALGNQFCLKVLSSAGIVSCAKLLFCAKLDCFVMNTGIFRPRYEMQANHSC